MRVVVLNEIPRDDKLAKEWNELVFQMEHPEVFYTYEWALAVSHAFSASIAPLLMLGYGSTELVGVAALGVRKEAADKVFFLVERTADYCDLISDPVDRPKVVDAVLHELKRLGKSELVMSNLPEVSVTPDGVRASAGKFGYYRVNGPTAICPQVTFGDLNERAEIQQSLNGKKTLRNLFNALSRIGRVEVHHSKDWTEARRILPAFFEAHIARFFATGRVSPYVGSERRLFLLTVSELLSARGWLTVSTISVNKRPIAWHIGFEFTDKCFWYMPTFDIEYERFGPGIQLLKSFLERAISQPRISSVDLGFGDEFYKRRFANTRQQASRLILTDSLTKRHRLLFRSIVAKNVRRSQSLERFAIRTFKWTSDASNLVRGQGIFRLALTVRRKVKRLLWARDQVALFEWIDVNRDIQKAESTRSVTLEPLDWTALAKAAMYYEHDTDTIAYLSCAGERLRKGGIQGFVLTTEDGVPVHFCWTSNFEGAITSKLPTALEPPSENAAILFDCWTPKSASQRGFQAVALRSVAERLSSRGKRSWMLSAVTNTSSFREIEKAGFEPRFRVVSTRFLLWKKVQTLTA